jgi:hypothetical protein
MDGDEGRFQLMPEQVKGIVRSIRRGIVRKGHGRTSG